MAFQRKASYKDWITKDGLMALESWARDGMTDEQIIERIGCATSTFYDWKNKYPEISEALKKGKRPVDFEVENSLLKKARGFEYEETETIREIDPYSNKVTKIVMKSYRKYSPPDTTAIIFWLKNRKPDMWQRLSPTIDKKNELDAEKIKLEIEKIEKDLAESKSTIIPVRIVDDIPEGDTDGN